MGTRRDPLAHIAEALADLERRGLRRTSRATLPDPRAADSAEKDQLPVSFSSNDYLGLAGRSAADDLGSGAHVGAGASRLISGDHAAHRLLETELAAWLGTEASLLFTSGYAANVGAISALVGPDDLVVSDTLNHASLIDGIRLARARVRVVRHNDVEAVEHELRTREVVRAWVVVESYYSMDADGPDLAALREVCDRHGAALIVDEAHALGVLGPGGRGRCAEVNVRPDVLVGTLGKSFGGQGAFVAGSKVLREWLWNRARSFVFSTGLSPWLAASALSALDEIRGSSRRRDIVNLHAKQIRAGLEQVLASLPQGTGRPRLTVLGFGHVVPILVGENALALRMAERLFDHGIDASAIRPPTVPAGTARIRLTVTARHREEDIVRALDVFRQVLGERDLLCSAT